MFIILNPVAGKGKALRERTKIEHFLENHQVPYTLVLTKKPGDALTIARECSLDAETMVVAAGGDGTSNEVANGLIGRHLPAPPLFGVLPVGRGNDFAFNAGVPPDLEKALNLLINRKTKDLDAGFVKGGFFPDGRYFINGVGMGFDTKVGFEAAKMKIQSGFSYILGALITLKRFEPGPLVEIRYGDTLVCLRTVLISVVNGRRMGGTFIVGPHAIINDGLLDLCFVEQTKTRRRLLQIVLQYTKGTQGTSPEVTMDRATDVHILAKEGTIAAHCDGETVCYEGTELNITIVPKALRLLCE